jgi:hypothetical protein
MKTIIKIVFCVVAGLVSALLFASGLSVADGVAVTVGDGKFELAAALIALLSPLVTAGVKLLWERIPTGLIPVVCSAAGLALALAAHYVAGLDVTWWQGLLLGLAGIGVREVVDRGRQAVAPPPM